MIGLIDSGVGGLSVLAAIEAVLPHEDCIYYADMAHFPYGNKPPVEILRHMIEATAFLNEGLKIGFSSLNLFSKFGTSHANELGKSLLVHT